MSFTTISVIGLGYIGLPTAAAFASRQKQVVGVDINTRAVETINRGEIHIVEPDLDRVVKEAVDGGYCAPVPRRLKPMLISLLCRRHSKATMNPIWSMSTRRRNLSRPC